MKDQLDRNMYRIFYLSVMFDSETKEMIKEIQMNKK